MPSYLRVQKPARKQGRNTQLEDIALAYARACALRRIEAESGLSIAITPSIAAMIVS